MRAGRVRNAPGHMPGRRPGQDRPGITCLSLGWADSASHGKLEAPAADIPVPYSGTKKSKKLSTSKAIGHPNNSSNPLEAIDTLFEEVEAMLRSTTIPPPICNDTIRYKKIPDIFRKRQQMSN
ncbi:hypothetical protein NDU88_005156 [Pleurodeles waltl]|uniref:Uncharacterized protein n=1 Tax=Pleurodeles waltl TaxID=8319 RepID=A0AAV7LNR6_PLEWA|nr:hypothetical protein NDU88_005156 [Pleurodeles waltl]